MTIAAANRDLNEALARSTRLEVEAKEWRIKSGLWRQKYEQELEKVTRLESQLRVALEAGDELIRMVDSLRRAAR